MQSGRSSSALFPELHQRQSGGLHGLIIGPIGSASLYRTPSPA